MPHVVESEDELRRAITARFSGSAVIGIDGWTCAGKSILARNLAEFLRGVAYDLDDKALNKGHGAYVSFVDTEKVASFLKSAGGFVFVSGVCLRQVMQNAGSRADAHIYVKRMAQWGWADEDEIQSHSPPIVGSPSGETLRQELRSYHELWCPHQIADLVYQRFE